MRVDARAGHTGYDIWDAERCTKPRHVVWADDETEQWGQATGRLVPGPLVEIEIATRQEKRILIDVSRKLVIFNPVDDDSDERDEETTPADVSFWVSS